MGGDSAAARLDLAYLRAAGWAAVVAVGPRVLAEEGLAAVHHLIDDQFSADWAARVDEALDKVLGGMDVGEAYDAAIEGLQMAVETRDLGRDLHTTLLEALSRRAIERKNAGGTPALHPRERGHLARIATSPSGFAQPQKMPVVGPCR
jgi:hypothetical protein